MERTIKVWRDPYDSCFNTTNKKEVTFHDGVTVLVGCNGAGKTTLIQNIKSELKNEKIPYFSYNNLSDRASENLSYFVNKGEYGNYIKFNSYDDYKKFIVHTREKKDKRIERSIVKMEERE